MILTPNPATDKLKVDNGQIHKELYIYDVVGKECSVLKAITPKLQFLLTTYVRECI